MRRSCSRIGTTSDAVLGQLDFTHNVPNLVDGKGLNFPQSVAIDSSATPNRVYVADEDNNRVLGWSRCGLVRQRRSGRPGDRAARFPLRLAATQTSAASLCKPAGVAVDGFGQPLRRGCRQQPGTGVPESVYGLLGSIPVRGRSRRPGLWPGRERHLEYLRFRHRRWRFSTSIDLCSPIGVAVDASGNLYVADSGNNRVLEYNTPLTTDITADHGLWPGRELHVE